MSMITAAEIYRRLILLSAEFRQMAEHHNTIEGKTALQVAGLVIRTLASGFFPAVPRHELQAEDDGSSMPPTDPPAGGSRAP